MQVSFFERLGLSRYEVAYMVEQFPDLLTYSVRGNFQPKVDYLVHEMGRSVDELVSELLLPFHTSLVKFDSLWDYFLESSNLRRMHLPAQGRLPGG